MIRVSVVSESEFTVQGHGVHTAYVELTNALRAHGECDVVVNQNGSADITHLHTVGLYALRRLLGDRSKKVVSAHIVPASLVGSLVGARLWLPAARLYLRWFYNQADLLFAVSDDTARELRTLGVTTPIETVYNLIDTSRYATTPEDKRAAREALDITAGDIVIVGAGQVQPRKRVDDFIAAARELPEYRFIWVGGMPFGKLAAEHGSMKQLIEAAPGNFSCTGVVDHADVKRYYQAADIFWLPSEQETFGLVVVEAAATGLPIVLRDIHDYDETFRDAALMSQDVGSAVEALRRLMTDDKLYEAMVRLSEEKIARRFDSVNGAKRVVELYRKLLSE